MTLNKLIDLTMRMTAVNDLIGIVEHDEEQEDTMRQLLAQKMQLARDRLSTLKETRSEEPKLTDSEKARWEQGIERLNSERWAFKVPRSCAKTNPWASKKL